MSSSIPSSSRALFSTGRVRTFTGRTLNEVAFPLGGIGTGTISLGGRGQLCDWEIFNRPGKGKYLPYTFFAIWAQREGGAPVARVLESRLHSPYRGGSGIPTLHVPGLPRLANARFTGTYPFASIQFRDDTLPVRVHLEAFNPFIPMNAYDSGLPVAIFRWTLTNPSTRPVTVTVAHSQLNPVGYDGQAWLSNRRHGLFDGNLNEFVRQDGMAGLRMTGSKYLPDDPRSGSFAVVSTHPDVTYLTHWERAGWWDDLQNFWDDFSSDGRLPDGPSPDPSPAGQTDVGTLGLTATLPPGGSATLPFILAWHFPNLINYWNAEEAVKGKRIGNYYTSVFPDAWAAAEYTARNFDRLERETRLYHETFFESTLPPYVLDAVSSQSSIIRTTTCLRTEDGRFHAFEGCNDNAGCCPMNCTHVWNYEQALAHLFPELERSMRVTDFTSNTLPSGHMAFRTLLPLIGETWRFKPAADGQMGTIMKLYREWLQGGNTGYLQELWPHAKSALEFAWSDWDPNRDGVMEGEQHNTYDIEFYGPNTMMGTFYLGALRAAVEMAAAVGDTAAAAEYRGLYERGRVRLDRELWNGEFYVQKTPGDVNEHRYQYGEGCLADQLLGQWFAAVVGLGSLLPEEHVKSALRAIFRYNFRPDFHDHANCQRVYALNDERGLLLCSWPNGGRPTYPFPYADEVWTGIEYQVAAHMIYEGLLEEGLTIVKGVRDRYDGERRNPWDEVECGHHYARAMASWSVLLALSGCRYSAPGRLLGFAPRWRPERFRCLFTAGTGWGSYAQRATRTGQQHTIDVRYGRITVQHLAFNVIDGKPSTAPGATVRMPNREVHAATSRANGTVTVSLATPATVEAGGQLDVRLAW